MVSCILRLVIQKSELKQELSGIVLLPLWKRVPCKLFCETGKWYTPLPLQVNCYRHSDSELKQTKWQLRPPNQLNTSSLRAFARRCMETGYKLTAITGHDTWNVTHQNLKPNNSGHNPTDDDHAIIYWQSIR